MIRLSIVITFRDRDVIRLERCLRSLARQSVDEFAVILVDYGSRLGIDEAVQRLAERFPFCSYIYSDTRGHIWNKSKALNIGIRRANSSYVLTTDADMIFARNFIETVLSHASPNRVLCCYPFHLPSDFRDWENVEDYQVNLYASRRSLGGCQCVPTAVAHDIRGFDEYYHYWGKEDLDYKFRLDAVGLEEVWLNEHTQMHHQWHPRYTAYTREDHVPSGFWWRMENYIQRNKAKVKRNDDSWGAVYQSPDRAIYPFIDFNNAALRQEERVRVVDVNPADNRALAEFVRAFWEVPAGNVVAIRCPEYLARSPVIDTAISLINRLSRRLALELNYRPNLIRDYFLEFLFENAEIVEDYFFGFPREDGLILLLKR